jgi:divalent metal cation (Fe/Co/Zn/Cd) transporter
MVTIVATKLMGDCLGELIEKAVDQATIEEIKDIIKTNTQIRQWHRLRTRTVGREVFLDLHILVDPHLNITEAHKIASNLEKALHKQITRPVNITVHVEPDIPRMRKADEKIR